MCLVWVDVEFIKFLSVLYFVSVRIFFRTLVAENWPPFEVFMGKMVIFRKFKQNLRLLMLKYRLEISNEGKKYQVTSFRGVSKHLDCHKLVYYTKNGQY